MIKINKILIFLFPVFFAMPDFSISAGPINLRYDDLIIYALFFININFMIKEIFLLMKNFFYRMQLILILYAILSLMMVVFIGLDDLLSNYEVIKSLGSIPYIIVLPYLLSKQKYRKYFYMGAFVGSFIYLFFLYSNYTALVSQHLMGRNTSASFKTHMSFSTLNPNAVATFAVILGWINILSYFEYKNKAALIIAFPLMFIPVFLFARSMSIGVIMAFIFINLSRKFTLKKLLYIILIIILFGLFVYNFIDLELLKDATDVDFSSGKGLSNRDVLWAEGLEIFKMSPIVGHGFATENGQFIKYFNGHMAHNLILHYLIELGLIGFVLFAISVSYLLHNRYVLARKTTEIFYIIQVALLLSFLIADLAGQLLYINKYAFTIYALANFNLYKRKKYV